MAKWSTYFTKSALCLLAAASFLCASGFARAEEYAAGTAGYLKSATYYSDDWVINFWNGESDHMDEELAQIAEDGFNSVILVVPWREFQPETDPCTYNDYAWDKLDQVMEAAGARGLGVMLRVGYTWDYYGLESSALRFRELLYDKTVQAAWLEYAGRLYERASAHENFCGGFITWEDFWNFAEDSTGFGNGYMSRQLADQYGLVAYAREHYSLEELEEFYGHELGGYEDIYFPEKESYARKLFYSYYDAFLNRLLEETQKVFPDLSMEVRLDADPVTRGDGSLEGFMHTATYPCGSSSFVSTMYSVPMGFPNQYERVTAAEALKNPPVFFNRVHAHSGGKPVYVDQFLFTDNTVGFEHNAQILDEEKALYLEQMAPVLKSMTMGYGIWTYRDYGDNKLYNAQFALGKQGWSFKGDSRVTEHGGSHMAVLSSGGSISQNVGSRITGTVGKDTFISLDVETEGEARVMVKAGNQSRQAVPGEDGRAELTFTDCSPREITISCQGSGQVYVDNVKAYTTVTRGELYEMDGSEGACIQAVRELNRQLP